MKVEAVERTQILIALAAGLLLAASALAKNKDATLPNYLLHCRTAAVLVDPEAGVDIEDPRANQVAQKDVETALLNWGRFEPVIGSRGADILIVLRKGHRHMVDQTINDPQQNSRAGVINPTENGAGIGVQRGRQPSLSGADRGTAQPPQHGQVEIGTTDDSFTVYQGSVEHPLDAPAGWRYVAKDCLHARTVPAVDVFRKALDAADKAAARHQP